MHVSGIQLQSVTRAGHKHLLSWLHQVHLRTQSRHTHRKPEQQLLVARLPLLFSHPLHDAVRPDGLARQLGQGGKERFPGMHAVKLKEQSCNGT